VAVGAGEQRHAADQLRHHAACVGRQTMRVYRQGTGRGDRGGRG
jgi:hypothetical protein